MRIEDLLARHVLPLGLFERVGSDYRPKATVGTAFTFGEGTMATCAHCVRSPLADSEAYGVAIKPSVYASSYEAVFELIDLAFDANGADIALARIGLRTEFRLCLAAAPFGWASDVVALGYPLPTARGTETPSPEFRTSARALKGSVVRIMSDDLTGKSLQAYELDMPAPGGISGAPLLNPQSLEIGGIVYGSGTEQVGDSPIYPFAKAYHLSVLALLRVWLPTVGLWSNSWRARCRADIPLVAAVYRDARRNAHH